MVTRNSSRFKPMVVGPGAEETLESDEGLSSPNVEAVVAAGMPATPDKGDPRTSHVYP